MDDEDGRCLLDVICDPQALNDFLHGSEKIDSDDLLDNTGDAASAFFEGAGLHVQEPSGNHLNAEQSQPATSVDLDFLEDDILGSPAGGAAALPNSEQPCDILQQSLQEANITEQTLEAEAELDLGSFQLPTLQPVVQAASDGTPQIFSGGADLIGLQQPAVLTHQALVQQPVGADVVNKAISVQPFLQQVGLGNVTIQPISNLQGLPNGSPGGTLGIAPIQVVGQQVMAINQPAQQIIAKQVQPSPVAAMPVGSYIAQPAPEQQQVTLASTGVSPQSAGLVIQKNLPAVATTTLNGSSMFGGVAGAPASQPLTVTSNLSSPLVQAQNVIIHRTPTPIQPKPAGVLQQKLYQITPKPFAPNNATLTIQNEAALQQQKAQQNLTFMAGKAGQNVVLSGFPQGLPANVFKQPPPQQPALSKPMSVHLLNQGSSIVIPAQHVPQAVLQGQNQFLLPGQLAGASAVQLPQQLSALPANMGGQILTASHPSGQAHIITSPGPGGQLIANQALPAQILTNQNIAGQLNLGQVLTSQNAHGTAHILSAPIQLQPGQVGQPALFQMPVSLAGGLTTQSQPAVAASLPGGAIGQPGQTVIQGVTLPSQVAMLNAAENLGPAVSIQPSAAAASSQSPGLVQPQPASAAGLLPGAEQSSILTVQAAPQPPAAPPPLQLSVQPPPPAPPPAPAQPSPGLASSSPEKIILGQAAAGAVISQDSMQMFLQQLPAGQQKLPGASPSHSLPHPPLGDSPQLQPAHLPQMPSPHAARPPSQPQPLSRPPSRPHSRPPSQPRPPSEPLARSCTPQAPLPGLYVIQNPLGPAPPLPPLRPPSQPPAPFQPPCEGQPPAAPPDAPHSHSPHFQLQFPPQGPGKPPTPTPALHLTAEPQRSFQLVPSQFPTLAAVPNPAPQQKQILDRFQQVPQGIILQAKQPPSSQAAPALGQFSSQPSSVLVSTQGVTVTTTPAPAHSHAPAAGPPPAAGIAAPAPAESKSFPSVPTPIPAGKGAAAQGKPGASLAIQQPVQAKPGVISSVSGLNLGKGPLQIQVVGKGLPQLVPSVPVQTPPLYDSKLGSLKKPPTLQPSKEACFLEQLHKHQGAVLHPDYKTSFRSFEDALQRLLPYHVYQGMLPSAQDYRKVDEEFEVVSAQLLKRTQAMLNKYRLLLLEESRRVSPSAEMVMIDRMFIQEEKTMLALDKQLAKEKPDEYVSSSSRSQSLSSSAALASASGAAPASENPKAPAAQTATQINPTKLVIKHSGGSPSVTWAKASPALDGDEDALPSRSKPPIKTYEARSRIGLKLKIKQEAGLSKVVHNTALDPVHQPPPPPPPVCRVIKTAEQHAPPAAAASQMNGTVEHVAPAPAEKKPAVTYCRLPLRKTYRENVDAFVAEKPAADACPKGGAPKADKVPGALGVKQEDGSRSVITSHKAPAAAAAAEKSRPEESSKLLFFSRSDARSLVLQDGAAPQKSDDSTSGLMKELAEVEDEFYRGMIKTEPPDHGAGSELAWEVPLPPAKRRKSESFDVDNASFSSDSPQDDSLNEHLQSAIDSILNLQQPQTGGQSTRTPSSSYNSSSSPFSSPVHRTDTYLAPSHNGGLGARTLNR
ncbi:BRD4-interacting chromatin-remodeling complex-associated protein isoform X1 [Cygnus olor]|uniref:BRD4-interacting chromatin-remodeling complex-associated protein isoform X1 n=1 Tax=Cygnus olor TaxID=8869 RepID=UPI001ADDFFFF|nr:BRD4-interacting chromatin-remodeling complex-associated protein isoform X1 [Cygnus olor]XP_040398961.1 BRD4-interacting chromatin-remodeling complex-associated protein isoform X1 [Cygnus olor]